VMVKPLFWTKWCKRCGKKFRAVGKKCKFCSDCYLVRRKCFSGKSSYYNELLRLRGLVEDGRKEK